MKLTPVASPHAVAPTGTNVQAANAARERAIQRLTSQQPVPLENPQNISVEELGAVQAPQPRQTTSNSTPATTPEAPAVEANTAPASESEQTPEQKADAARWASLMRREKQARIKAQQDQQRIAAKEAELAAREAALAKAPAQTFDPKEYIPKSRLKEDLVQLAAEQGMTYDEITQQFVNAPQRNPHYENLISELKAEISSLKQGVETTNKNIQEQQTQSYKAAIDQIRQDVKQAVARDPAYETVRATNSVNDVVELIERTWNEEKRVMPVEEAIEEVENYLIDEALKLTRIEKIKKRLNATGSASTPTDANKKPNNPQQPQPMKTLTNATSSTRQLSAKERAVLAFRGELKS